MDATGSREKILSSAIEVFAEKGKNRATIDEIAMRAGVQKSVLRRNYSKDGLYREALERITKNALRRFADGLGPPGAGDGEAHDRIANASLDAFSQDLDSAKVVLDAVVNDTGEFLSIVRDVKSRTDGPKDAQLTALIEGMAAQAGAEGAAPAATEHLLSALVAMGLTYLLAKPIAEAFLDMDVKNEEAFLGAMRESLIDLWTRAVCEGGVPASLKSRPVVR